MGSFLFWLEGATLFENKGSNSFGLQGQFELDFPSTVKRYIASLKKRDFLQRTGSDKTGDWVVVKE